MKTKLILAAKNKIKMLVFLNIYEYNSWVSIITRGEDMNDKRQHSRIKKSIRAEIHTSDGMTFSSTLDMSAKGVFISTPEPIDQGKEVSIIIPLTPTDHISVSGVVRWIRGEDEDNRAGMGIEFVDISDVTLNVLRNLSEL